MKTLNHRFRLKGTDPVKPVGILYMCSINNKVFQYGVGYTIAPELWNQETKRPTTSKQIIKEYKKEIPSIETLLTNITRRIDNICHEVETFIQTARMQGVEIDHKLLTDHLDRTVKKSTRTIDNRPKRIKKAANNHPAIDLTLIGEYAKRFVIDIENGHRTIRAGTNSQKKYNQSTVKNFKGFLPYWFDFEKKQVKKYKWPDLGRSLYSQFLHYLYNRDLSESMVGRLVKHWKVIAQAAFDDNIHTNLAFRDQYFKMIIGKIHNISLTEEEVNKLEKLNLSDRPTWEKARDLFLIGCYTALRFGDIITLNPTEFVTKTLKGGKNGPQKALFIDKITQKTKERVQIKVKSELNVLMKKYNYYAPQLAEQTVNEIIKEIAQFAGIDTPIQKKETRGGKDQINIYQKFELITTHTARRTAATQMHHQKLPHKYIMAITGHKTLSSFEKYICMELEEESQAAANHEFFN